MVKVNYRVVTLFSALASAILTAITLAFLVTAIVEFRAKDFLFASKTLDFDALGTCVETLTGSQIDAQKYNDIDKECKEDIDKGMRGELRDALSVSVHGMYYTHYKSTYDDPNGLPESPVWRVMSAMLTHITNEPHVGPPPEATVPIGVNFTTGHTALKAVANLEDGVPTSCEDIYAPLTYAADIATDDDLLQYIEDIRDGRLNTDGEVKDTWPLADLVIDCNTDAGSVGSGALVWADQNTPTPAEPPAAVKKKLFAHCYAQFLYSSVGVALNAGTQSIPTPGIVSGPRFNPYPKADGFNSTSSYNMKTRMYLGQRFGWSVWAYVPMFLATCFLLADSMVFFFAEATMPYTLSQQAMFSTSALNQVRDSLVIAATGKSARRFRLSAGFLAVLVSCIFYGIFIAAPWGFVYSNLPRPDCEKTDATPAMGKAPEHGVPLLMWKGTRGGWKSDYDATFYDLATLFTQIFVLLLLPLTTTSMCRNLNKSLNGQGDGRVTKAAVAEQAQVVHNSAKFRLMQNAFTGLMVVGIIIIIVGQSISGARFGMAWAEGVVAVEDIHHVGTIFDEIALSEAVYDQTVATLALVVACGLVFGVVIQRHLIAGVGCFSAGLLFGWIALVVLCALPITIYAASRSIFNEKSASKDCVTFPRESHEFENDLCVARFWTLLVGGGIFFGTILAMTVLGVATALQALFASRKRAAVFLKPLVKPSQVFRASTPGMSQQEGYRSKSESFFNYEIKKAPDHNQLLYAPPMAVPAAHR